MKTLSVVCALCLWGGVQCVISGTRYAFWRESGGAAGLLGARATGRRVFGGAAAALADWGGVCVLTDRYWTPRCSGSVISKNWVLTAAHCISPRIAYIKYNTRRSLDIDGNVTAVLYLYRHPKYKVLQEDEGRGMDVTQLHHDLGLVRTRSEMDVVYPPPLNALRSIQKYSYDDIQDQDITVFGFGRTEGSSLGEELFVVRLRAVQCARRSWVGCMCGVARGGARSGVCSGDSGGPVIYRGAQIAVTSMGPVECSSLGSKPAEGATSVFTLLHDYSDIVEGTIDDAESQLSMMRISRGTLVTPTIFHVEIIPLLVNCLNILVEGFLFSLI